MNQADDSHNMSRLFFSEKKKKKKKKTAGGSHEMYSLIHFLCKIIDKKIKMGSAFILLCALRVNVPQTGQF